MSSGLTPNTALERSSAYVDLIDVRPWPAAQRRNR